MTPDALVEGGSASKLGKVVPMRGNWLEGFLEGKQQEGSWRPLAGTEGMGRAVGGRRSRAPSDSLGGLGSGSVLCPRRV